MKHSQIHTPFFSSLKQVEKRLKLDHPPPHPPSFTHSPSPPPPPPPPQQKDQSNPERALLPPDSNYTLVDSLSSPLYLNFDTLTANTSTSTHSQSQPPPQFLSNSPDFPSTPTQDQNQNPLQLHPSQTANEQVQDNESDDNDIELLMQLLGLSDSVGKEEKGRAGFGLGLDCGGDGNCGCGDGFYSKVVGVMGPKCGKEAERLEAWVKHYSKGKGSDKGVKMEPLRLAHLLLGKAALVYHDSDDAFGQFEFPSSIDEFLQNDPPTS